MAEIQLQLREQKVLKALSQMVEPVQAGDLEESTGEPALQIGNALHKLAKAHLAELTDKKKKLWVITDDGRQLADNIELQQAPPPVTATVTPEKTAAVTPPATEEVTVPKQADILRYYGEKLRVGIGKGGKQEGTPLDAIIFFVQETADLNDLNSVWNALSKMAVPSDVKRRWIELYAKSIPGKEIPEELKEKLEVAPGEDKVRTAAEDQPKVAKRFNVIDGQIIPDPEGEYNFSMAIQKAMAERGASQGDAAQIAATFAKMSADTLNTILPILTAKETPKESELPQTIHTLKELGLIGKTGEESGTLQTIQTLKELGLIGKTGEEGKPSTLDDIEKLVQLGILRRPGEGDTATSQTIQALQEEVKGLKDTLQKQELDNVKSVLSSVSEQVKELRLQVKNTHSLEGRYALIDKGMDNIGAQLTGIRGDVRPLVETIIKAGGPPPPGRVPQDKSRLSQAGKKAVEDEKRARALEDELLGS